LKRSGKRYSGKPDGGAGTPREETQNFRISEKFMRLEFFYKKRTLYAYASFCVLKSFV
jgi:hypothetical protein